MIFAKNQERFLLCAIGQTLPTSNEIGRSFRQIQDIPQMTRVNSINILDEGLRIEEIGRRMNSKVRLVGIGVYRK
jgi:hypothetical protein